jgi:hypothetical protein
MKEMARPGRLELPTLCLEGRRSVQLSYGRLPLISHIAKASATAAQPERPIWLQRHSSGGMTARDCAIGFGPAPART